MQQSWWRVEGIEGCDEIGGEMWGEVRVVVKGGGVGGGGHGGPQEAHPLQVQLLLQPANRGEYDIE